MALKAVKPLTFAPQYALPTVVIRKPISIFAPTQAPRRRRRASASARVAGGSSNGAVQRLNNFLTQIKLNDGSNFLVSVLVLRHQGIDGKHPIRKDCFYYQARMRDVNPQKHICSGFLTKEEMLLRIRQVFEDQFPGMVDSVNAIIEPNAISTAAPSSLAEVTIQQKKQQKLQIMLDRDRKSQSHKQTSVPVNHNALYVNALEQEIRQSLPQWHMNASIAQPSLVPHPVASMPDQGSLPPKKRLRQAVNSDKIEQDWIDRSSSSSCSTPTTSPKVASQVIGSPTDMDVFEVDSNTVQPLPTQLSRPSFKHFFSATVWLDNVIPISICAETLPHFGQIDFGVHYCRAWDKEGIVFAGYTRQNPTLGFICSGWASQEQLANKIVETFKHKTERNVSIDIYESDRVKNPSPDLSSFCAFLCLADKTNIPVIVNKSTTNDGQQQQQPGNSNACYYTGMWQLPNTTTFEPIPNFQQWTTQSEILQKLREICAAELAQPFEVYIVESFEDKEKVNEKMAVDRPCPAAAAAARRGPSPFDVKKRSFSEDNVTSVPPDDFDLNGADDMDSKDAYAELEDGSRLPLIVNILRTYGINGEHPNKTGFFYFRVWDKLGVVFSRTKANSGYILGGWATESDLLARLSKAFEQKGRPVVSIVLGNSPQPRVRSLSQPPSPSTVPLSLSSTPSTSTSISSPSSSPPSSSIMIPQPTRSRAPSFEQQIKTEKETVAAKGLSNQAILPSFYPSPTQRNLSMITQPLKPKIKSEPRESIHMFDDSLSSQLVAQSLLQMTNSIAHFRPSSSSSSSFAPNPAHIKPRPAYHPPPSLSSYVIKPTPSFPTAMVNQPQQQHTVTPMYLPFPPASFIQRPSSAASINTPSLMPSLASFSVPCPPPTMQSRRTFDIMRVDSLLSQIERPDSVELQRNPKTSIAHLVMN